MRTFAMRWMWIGLLAACEPTTSRPVATAGSASSSTSVASEAVAAAPANDWAMPPGWRGEVIPFPLDFAPTIVHTGVEELRFPPGFFDPTSPEYWSYAFIWRTDDPAVLDAAALGVELTLYFRGLIAAVDTKHKITARDQIVAAATRDGARFKLTAHVFDAFKTAAPVDLVGFAERHACGSGALWVFVLAPSTTSLRAQLDELAAAARCR